MRTSPWAIIIIVLALADAHASKPYPLPTLENLTGAWVATGRWGGQYRLVINSDGTGCLGVISLYDEPLLADIEVLEIERYRIVIGAHSRTQAGDRYLLKGEARGGRVTLESKAFFGKSKVTFYRESEWQRSTAKLSEAMTKATE